MRTAARWLLVSSLSLACLLGHPAMADVGPPGFVVMGVVVFPNPCRPDVDGFVTFANLPATAAIRVFNPWGELVAAFNSTPMGMAIWNFKGLRGEALPDDVYYAVITDAATKRSAIRFFFKEIGGPGTTIARNMPALSPGTVQVPLYDVMGNLTGNANLVIRGTETGEVSLVGGVKGYVNPAKGEKLIIGFRATGPGAVRARIFDNRGRLVRELSAADGTQGGSLQWDGRDSGGNVVSSGIYLVHVDGPGIDMTKRTVILK